jgi:phytoene dehydrogenase-like protein
MNRFKGTDPDVCVVGAGPNGLAAAITLARAGQSVLVLEGHETIGGGMRTAELTLPGYRHDVCSAVHPMAVASPFFRSIPLGAFGLEWVYPPVPLAHPLDDGTAVVLERSLECTARALGTDGDAYRRLMAPFVVGWDCLMHEFLGPLRFPRHPLLFLRFGLKALLPAALLARRTFAGERARALFAGLAAHAIMPLDHPLTSGFGLMLGLLGHAVGWPFPRGGSGALAEALGGYLESLGGEILTGNPVRSIYDLPRVRAALLDVTPRQLLRLAGRRLPPLYRWQLGRYRYGPGVFKVDWALDGPIPWRAAACARAGTVHLGGTLDEIVAGEQAAWRGPAPERPFVLLAQPSMFDPTRAPEGKQAIWAYCHVPNGSTEDMTERIEAQVERFAPGFRNRILARSTLAPAALQQYNPNDVGGDINGGVADLWQFYARPAVRLDPYRTPLPWLYLCSASTPPGGGVHGMCGYSAARSALRRIGRRAR